MSLSSKNFQQIKASCTFFIAHINRIQNILNRKKGHNMPNISFLFFLFPYTNVIVDKNSTKQFFLMNSFCSFGLDDDACAKSIYGHKS